MNPTQPDFRKVSCYRRQAKDGATAVVWINMEEISTCERAFQGGELFFAVLTMKDGRDYFISEDDYNRLFPNTGA